MARKIAAKHKVKIPVEPMFAKRKQKPNHHPHDLKAYAAQYEQTKRKPVVEKQKPGLIRRSGTKPFYGEFGLVQYTDSDRVLFDSDILHYSMVPPGKLTMDSLVKSQTRNLFAIYSSMCRMIYQFGATGVPAPKTKLSEFDYLDRQIQCDYLEDYLVGFREHEAVWLKHYPKIFKRLDYEFRRIGSSFARHYPILATRPDTVFKAEYADLILALWNTLGMPKSIIGKFHTHLRFYVFTSSIPGAKPSEKLEFLKSLPKEFLSILCLVGNDIKLKQLTVIAKHLKCRATLDPTLVKFQDKAVRSDTPELLALADCGKLDNTSTSVIPVFFLARDNATEKFLRYYGSMGSVLLYDA